MDANHLFVDSDRDVKKTEDGSEHWTLRRAATLWDQSCQDRLDEYEDSLYDKVLFKVWLCLVLGSLYAVIAFLAFRLPEGIPI